VLAAVLAASVTLAACGGGSSSTSTVASNQQPSAPAENFAQNPPTGKPKKGAPKEYRVSAELQVDMPKGAIYSLEPQNSKCVNDKRQGPYGPTTNSPDKSELWMYASESFLPQNCITLLSYQRWDFHLIKPVEGHYLINLGQGCNGCKYETQCESWYKDSLHCETPSKLAIKLSR
jgi:hypothetical protein